MHRTLITALSIVLVAGLSSAPVDARCGDCNGDSNTNILDALQAAQHGAMLVTLTGTRFIACNVNGTPGSAAAGGSVNILDALTVAQFSASLPTVLKCAEDIWPIRCGANDTSTLTVATTASPPVLTNPDSVNFYSLEGIPAAALSVEIILTFPTPADYDLLVGGTTTVPGETAQANYPFQSRFSRPERILIDSTTNPSIGAITAAGNPLAIAVHLFSNPGQSYNIQVNCTLPIPPSVINISLGQSILQTTTAVSTPGPDLLVTGSTHWFVLNTFPASMQHLDIVMTNLGGDHDIYLAAPGVLPATQYSLANYPTSRTTTMTTESINLTAAQLSPYGGGPLIVAVTAKVIGSFTIQMTGYSDLTCTSNVNANITSGSSPTRGQLSNGAVTRFYKLDGVSLAATEIRIELTGTAPTGDVDLYVGTTMWGDPIRANYEFRGETAGTSSETIIIDSTTTPDIFAFLGSPIAVAISAFAADNVTLSVTCMSGGPPPGGVRNIACGGTIMDQVTTPSGMSTPPILTIPGTTDFYCLTTVPVGTAFVTFEVTGAAGSEYMLLIGDVGTPCGSTNPNSYVFISTPTQSPMEEVSVCTTPSLSSYLGSPIAVAVHWVSGTTPDYTLEVICDPTPMFCAPSLTCGSFAQGGLPFPTGQFPTVTFTQGADTDFFVLFPVPQGVGQITFTLGSPLDNDADYDLFVGGPLTQPCATSSSAYQFASQLSAPLLDVIILSSAELLQFGCNPIPIAVYYFRDIGVQGGYDLSITCN